MEEEIFNKIWERMKDYPIGDDGGIKDDDEFIERKKVRNYREGLNNYAKKWIKEAIKEERNKHKFSLDILGNSFDKDSIYTKEQIVKEINEIKKGL